MSRTKRSLAGCWKCRVLEELIAEHVMRFRREMWATAIASVAERHGLDDADAARHVRLHAINGPEMTQ